MRDYSVSIVDILKRAPKDPHDGLATFLTISQHFVSILKETSTFFSLHTFKEEKLKNKIVVVVFGGGKCDFWNIHVRSRQQHHRLRK